MSSDGEDRLCGNLNCNAVGKHLCSSCGEEIYCSKECQKTHWTSHKHACKAAVKPEAAALMQNPFEQLSVKQLKNLIKAKSATMEGKKKDQVRLQTEQSLEKHQLLWLVKQHVHPAEIEALLSASVVAPTIQEVPSSGAGKSKKRNAHNQRGSLDAMMGQPKPDLLRQQAKQMRKDPDAVRKMNPLFAKMTNAQILGYADQLDKAANDPKTLKEYEKLEKLSKKRNRFATNYTRRVRRTT